MESREAGWARHSGYRKGSLKGRPFREKEKEAMTGTEVNLEKVEVGALHGTGAMTVSP